MAKSKKTNAMRILERNKIQYKFFEYEVIEGKTDGVSVAMMIGKNPNHVFKTLVTQSNSKEYYVFVIPVGQELDLKKAAKVAGQKRIEMIPMKSLLQITGYIHGGCSPIGMKKLYTTYIHETVLEQKTIVCSGGKRGLQIEVAVGELIRIVNALTADLIK